MAATKKSFPPSTRDALEKALRKRGCVIQGDASSCPSPDHLDRNPSASIICGEKDQRWRVFCHRCEKRWDLADVMKLPDNREASAPQVSMAGAPGVGGEPQDGGELPVYLFPPVEVSDDPGLASCEALLSGVVARHEYRNAENEPVFVVFRLRTCREGVEGKSYRQAHRRADGSWIMKKPPGQLPIYRLPDLLDAHPDRIILMVEGEKTADALDAIGILATTTSGGAGKSSNTDLSPLAGRTVLLAPDHDEPGQSHMKEVGQSLGGLNPPATVLWLDSGVYGLPSKGDLADVIAIMRGEGAPTEAQLDRVGNLLDGAQPWGSGAEFDQLLTNVTAGLHRPIEWPWYFLQQLTGGIEPISVTMLCGTPGSGKSLFVLWAVIAWLRQGHSVRMLELEPSGGMHYLRAMALIAQEPRLADKRWIEENPGTVDALKQAHRAEIDSVVAAMTMPIMGAWTRDDVLRWITERIKSGIQIIIVDPITAVGASSGEKVWDADQRFIMEARRLVENTQSRLIIVTHPRAGTRVPSTDAMQGGLAYGRFSDQVLWLVRNDKPVRLKSGVDAEPVAILDLCKVRNNRGTNQKIALSMVGLRINDDDIIDQRPRQDRPRRQVPSQR